MRASDSSWPSTVYEMRQSPRSVAATKSSPTGDVDEVVADVDEALANGGRAEAGVEIRRDAHVSLLSLRTPDDAAARAASSDEPSAAPIWA